MESIKGLTYCYEKISTRFLVIDESTKKLVCECLISKTKVDILFEIPKTYNNSIMLHHRYESLKGSEIIVTLSKSLECYQIIENRIKEFREIM